LYLSCTHCGGTGLVDGDPCQTCSGSGQIENPCQTCNGAGSTKCNQCHGSGKCKNCGGTGTIGK
jgi:DnaJ-class molecular chaperone